MEFPKFFKSMYVDPVPEEGDFIFHESPATTNETKNKASAPWDKPKNNSGSNLLDKNKTEGPEEPEEPEVKEESSLIKIFKRYNIGEEISYEEQCSVLLWQLRREIATGDLSTWRNIQDKKLTDLDGSKRYDLEDMDKLVNKERLDNINKVAEYFISVLGEKAKIQEDETIKEWTRRIVKISFETGK